MSGYGHEDVVKITRTEKLKKRYQKLIMFIFAAMFVIMIIIIYYPPVSETVDGFSGFPISRTIGFIMAVPLLIIGFRPTWFRIGDVFYFKTVLTTKWDYDQYRVAAGWRKWFSL